MRRLSKGEKVDYEAEMIADYKARQIKEEWEE